MNIGRFVFAQIMDVLAPKQLTRCIDRYPKWRAPKGAELSFKFYCTQPQTLLVNAGRASAEIEITASD
jgi:hypothetical protein